MFFFCVWGYLTYGQLGYTAYHYFGQPHVSIEIFHHVHLWTPSTVLHVAAQLFAPFMRITEAQAPERVCGLRQQHA